MQTRDRRDGNFRALQTYGVRTCVPQCVGVNHERGRSAFLRPGMPQNENACASAVIAER